MKHLKYIIVAVAVALFAASCSQDELPDEGEGTPATGQAQVYTFTVSPDIVMEGDAGTRSEGTDAEMPTRCFMQVFDSGEPVNNDVIEGVKEDGSFIFTITLASGKSYDYCFYADNGNHDINDLRNITWQNTGKVVAYAHKWSGEPEEEMSVTLEHIVTKITLKHVGEPFMVSAGEEFKITFPCADTYNVLDNAASTGNGYEDFTYTFDKLTGIVRDDEVCTFYTIVPQNVADYPDITLTYRWRHLTIAGVTLKQNAHVVLQGDLSESSDKWNPTSASIEAKFRSYFYGDNGFPKGYNSQQLLPYEYQNGTIEDVTLLMKEITCNDSFVIPSNDVVIITDNLSLENTPECIYIDYNDTQFIIHPDTDLGCLDFSIIYPGT